jgi:hypothetical protein
MKELIDATEQMRVLDTNVEFIMNFLKQPDKHFLIVEKFINDSIVKFFNPSQTFVQLTERRNQVMGLLNDKWWHNTYPVHDQHFHNSFESFCNCPFTCMTEIIDCLDKIAKGA